MELPWNICPYCGTPAPGMRREHLTLDEALRPLPEESEELEEVEVPFPETIAEADLYSESKEDLEQLEDVPQSEEPEE